MQTRPADGHAAAERTVQLRRYVLAPGSYAEFTSWWAAKMRPLRLAAGFTVDFAFGVPESNEFLWAVSAPGDRAAFLALEATYQASAARAEVMRTQPEPARSMQIDFVDVVE